MLKKWQDPGFFFQFCDVKNLANSSPLPPQKKNQKTGWIHTKKKEEEISKTIFNFFMQEKDQICEKKIRGKNLTKRVRKKKPK